MLIERKNTCKLARAGSRSLPGAFYTTLRRIRAFLRLGRYETALWRQVCQAVFMLEVLRRQGLDMKWLPRSFRPEGSKFFALSVPRRE